MRQAISISILCALILPIASVGCGDSADDSGDASLDDGGRDAGDGDGDGDGDGGGDGDGDGDGDGGTVDPGESAFEGAKDLSFGTNGVLDTGVDGAPLIDVIAAPDDKLLLFTGNPMVSTTSRRVYRFGYDGALDTTYATAGIATLEINDIGPRPFGGGPFTVDTMGRAYYIESRASFEGVGFISAVYIHRLGTHGMPDASFGTGGTFTLHPSMLTGLEVASVSAAAIAVLEDGSILIGGFVQTTQSDTDGEGRQWAVIKLPRRRQPRHGVQRHRLRADRQPTRRLDPPAARRSGRLDLRRGQEARRDGDVRGAQDRRRRHPRCGLRDRR
jgi:hypothetical protein